jgi:hypothetical protein
VGPRGGVRQGGGGRSAPERWVNGEAADMFGRRCSTVAGELWWPAVTKVWPCSSEKEGRAEVVP